MADASTNVRGFQDIPHFQIEEIQRVLKQMSSRKTGAVDGVAGKIFKYGNVVLHSCLWNIYNILQQYVCWILRIFRNRGNTHRFQDDTKLEAPLLLKIGGESQS